MPGIVRHRPRNGNTGDDFLIVRSALFAEPTLGVAVPIPSHLARPGNAHTMLALSSFQAARAARSESPPNSRCPLDQSRRLNESQPRAREQKKTARPFRASAPTRSRAILCSHAQTRSPCRLERRSRPGRYRHLSARTRSQTRYLGQYRQSSRST